MTISSSTQNWYETATREKKRRAKSHQKERIFFIRKFEVYYDSKIEMQKNLIEDEEYLILKKK